MELTMLNAIKTFMKEEDGLTAVEYAIAGGVVTAGLVAALGFIGADTKILIELLKTNIAAAKPAPVGG